MPAVLAPAACPPVTSMAQPPTAAVVAASQRIPGRLPRWISKDKAPVKTGAAPMVTTAPTATPARAVAVKKAVWYAATAAAPIASRKRVRVPRRASSRSAPPRSAITNSSRPPPTTRAAPTATGPAPAGAKVRAVAVVPHRGGASRVQEAPPRDGEECRIGVLRSLGWEWIRVQGARKTPAAARAAQDLRVEMLGCAPVRRRRAG